MLEYWTYCPGQQAGWTYKQRFQVDLAGEGGGVLITQEEPGAAETLGSNRETPVNCLKRIRAKSSKQMMQPMAQLKCLYTNVGSMGDKQELVATAQMESYTLIAITKSWWDESHDWSAVIDSYKLFRRDS